MPVHHCSENTRDRAAVSIVADSTGDWNGSWRICLERRASAEDVREGEAAEVGELLHASEIAIRYCPFCGAAF
jgi:hypothetical protein